MKEILLVFPGKPGFEERKKIPLALLFLAGPLIKNDYKVKILDERVENYKKLNYNKYLCVGISTQSGRQILHALKIAKFIRNKNPKIKIIWGGIHPTLLSDSTIKNKYVDVVVKGDGEFVFLELVNAIKDNKPLKNIKGVVYKENDKIIFNRPADPVDLDKLDLPNYDLLDLRKYYYKEGFPMITSRGCYHRCAFCCTRGKWRGRSAVKIIEDIEKEIKKYNPNIISFADNTFFYNKKRIREFCEEKIKRNIKVKWKADCRLDYFARYDDEFISLLKKSGCISLLFGAESGSQRILDLLKKDMKVKDTIDSIKMCKKHEIIPVLGFIIGSITETKKEIFETLRFMDYLIKINPKTIISISLLIPWPGTEIFEEFKKKGFKEPKTLEGWARFNGGDINNSVHIPSRYKRLYKTIQMVSRFPFFKKNPKKSPIAKGHNKLPLPKEIAYRFFHKCSILRWKYKFFYFGFEWNFYDMYIKRYGRY